MDAAIPRSTCAAETGSCQHKKLGPTGLSSTIERDHRFRSFLNTFRRALSNRGGRHDRHPEAQENVRFAVEREFHMDALYDRVCASA
jgi:hypothetical protein